MEGSPVNGGRAGRLFQIPFDCTWARSEPCSPRPRPEEAAWHRGARRQPTLSAHGRCIHLAACGPRAQARRLPPTCPGWTRPSSSVGSPPCPSCVTECRLTGVSARRWPCVRRGSGCCWVCGGSRLTQDDRVAWARAAGPHTGVSTRRRRTKTELCRPSDHGDDAVDRLPPVRKGGIRRVIVHGTGLWGTERFKLPGPSVVTAAVTPPGHQRAEYQHPRGLTHH